MGRKRKPKRIKGTIDAETDPFLFMREPEPFAWGVYIDGVFTHFWGNKKNWMQTCTQPLVDFLFSLRNVTLYAHNGGKFDFHFLLPYANKEEITIINGRIAVMWIGDVKLVDSALLLPFPLDEYKKTKIDYTKFEADVREKNKKEIVSYLRDDCVDLYELLTGFHSILGDHLTIGTAAFANMRKLGITIRQGNESHDTRYRDFFFGGRTQVFEQGYHPSPKKPFLYIDINSAYPYAMTHNHPASYQYTLTTVLPRRKLTCEFIEFTGRSLGALPVRDEDGLLYYPVDVVARRYKTTGWELQAGLDTGTIIIDQIHQVHIPDAVANFKPFVDKFYAMKAKCKVDGDLIGTLAYKYCQNAGYGKQATNPREFKDYKLGHYDDSYADYNWDFDVGAISVHSRSSYVGRGFYDVAVGASITGFVRAYLWRTVLQTTRPMYTDTDSIICESYNKKNVQISPKLGDWSLDAKCHKLAIAGKKLYCYYDGKEWQSRSKGAVLAHTEIIKLCRKETVIWRKPAPSYSVRYGARFTKRKIKMRTIKT